MYNLTVDEAHTYFVGEGQWLVHNACSRKLDNALGGAKGDNLQAHHLIPGEYETHPMVAEGIRRNWDIDGASNGMHLPSTDELSRQLDLPLHNTNHPAYSDFVESRLDRMQEAFERDARNGEPWSDERVRSELDGLTDEMKRNLEELGGGVRVPKDRGEGVPPEWQD